MNERRWIKLLPLLASGLLVATPSAPAAVVLAEYFDYGTVDVAGNTSTVPFGGQPWQAVHSQFVYKESDVSNNNAARTGSGYVLSSDNGNTGSLRIGSGSTRGVQLSVGTGLTGEFWVSALIRAESITTVGSSVFLSLNNQVYNSASPGGFGIGVANQGGVLRSTITAANGVASVVGTDAWTTGTGSSDFYLVLAQITLNPTPAGVDTINLWTFANNASAPTTLAGLGTPTVTSTANLWTLSSLGNIFVGQRTATGSIDAIRISNLSGQAGFYEAMGIVPEPATAGLLVMALALLSRRALRAATRLTTA